MAITKGFEYLKLSGASSTYTSPMQQTTLEPKDDDKTPPSSGSLKRSLEEQDGEKLSLEAERLSCPTNTPADKSYAKGEDFKLSRNSTESPLISQGHTLFSPRSMNPFDAFSTPSTVKSGKQKEALLYSVEMDDIESEEDLHNEAYQVLSISKKAPIQEYNAVSDHNTGQRVNWSQFNDYKEHEYDSVTDYSQDGDDEVLLACVKQNPQVFLLMKQYFDLIQ